MNGYVCIYSGKRIEVLAATLYAARLQAIALLKVPKSKQGLLSVTLAETASGPVVHNGSSL